MSLRFEYKEYTRFEAVQTQPSSAELLSVLAHGLNDPPLEEFLNSFAVTSRVTSK
jgi:hypothetical protein